jgi:hypothetical protein
LPATLLHLGMTLILSLGRLGKSKLRFLDARAVRAGLIRTPP